MLKKAALIMCQESGQVDVIIVQGPSYGNCALMQIIEVVKFTTCQRITGNT